MKTSQRSRRVGDMVARQLGELLRSIRLDPDPGFLTITGCEVSVDLRMARVFYSVYGDDAAWARAQTALDRSRGRLRHELGRNVSLRHTPQLEFVADHTAENADHMEQVLRDTVPPVDDEESSPGE